MTPHSPEEPRTDTLMLDFWAQDYETIISVVEPSVCGALLGQSPRERMQGLMRVWPTHHLCHPELPGILRGEEWGWY